MNTADFENSGNFKDSEKIDYLIIGYGNTLRSDDGVGYRIAETVAQWNLNSVRSLSVHQLTPELAETMSHAKTIIFVDAVLVNAALRNTFLVDATELSPNLSPEPSLDPASTIALELVEPDLNQSLTAHHINPPLLLALCHQLYHALPIVYQLLIPVQNFDVGETLSATAAAHSVIALEKIKKLVLPHNFHTNLE